jgi:hypothetical protein
VPRPAEQRRREERQVPGQRPGAARGRVEEAGVQLGQRRGAVEQDGLDAQERREPLPQRARRGRLAPPDGRRGEGHDEGERGGGGEQRVVADRRQVARDGERLGRRQRGQSHRSRRPRQHPEGQRDDQAVQIESRNPAPPELVGEERKRERRREGGERPVGVGSRHCRSVRAAAAGGCPAGTRGRDRELAPL